MKDKSSPHVILPTVGKTLLDETGALFIEFLLTLCTCEAAGMPLKVRRYSKTIVIHDDLLATETHFEFRIRRIVLATIGVCRYVCVCVCV